MSAESAVPNGGALPLASVATGPLYELRDFVMEKVAGGARLAALFPVPKDDGFTLLAVMASQQDEKIHIRSADIGDAYPSLTPECLAAHGFEREMAETWGIAPQGHPWLKPLRFHPPRNGRKNPQLPGEFARRAGPGVIDYFRVEGEDVHEVAVGPVHAGVIEPGHFRFQCHGEDVFHLEISLGYQYRAIEKALTGGPDRLTRHRMETAAGDTTCGHALAYSMNCEALASMSPPRETQRIRAVGLELERLANHVGDLGALAGDIGYLPTASYCGRLRGDILNLTALLCGNRFGRGLIVPGGLGLRAEAAVRDQILMRLPAIQRDVDGALKLMFTSPSVMARLENTGKLDRVAADHLGVVGMAARSSGIEIDVRLGLPHYPYRRDLFQLALDGNGDVLARARQRQAEIAVSFQLVRDWLESTAEAPAADPYALPSLKANSIAVAMTEGWRGQICHVAVTDDAGKFLAYKLVDPSFHNWFGLAMAMRNQQISDFPLVNKSFNLSYCGYDL